MAKHAHNARRAVTGAAALVGVIGLMAGTMAQAQDGFLGGLFDNGNGKTNERYAPTIWVDPDGCEHWVMDDGAEGYMSNHVNRQGIPVCNRQNVCGVMNTDQYFATDSYRLTPGGQQNLVNFFRSASARAYIIVGHTDSRASDEYNMRLSYNRANAVAAVASQVGAKIIDVRGYGERVPKAANNTAGGMAQNRRVEIICIR